MTEREVAEAAADVQEAATALKGVAALAEAGGAQVDDMVDLSRRLSGHAKSLLNLIPERPVVVRDRHPRECPACGEYAEAGPVQMWSNEGDGRAYTCANAHRWNAETGERLEDV